MSLLKLFIIIRYCYLFSFSLHKTSADAYRQPSTKAKDLGKVMSHLIKILIVITFIAFISRHFIVGVFSIGTIITMIHATYYDDRYDIESSQRIIFFSGYLCIFNTIACIQSISTYYSNMMDQNKFIGYCTWILLIGGCVFYGWTAYISNQLYNELRINCEKFQPKSK